MYRHYQYAPTSGEAVFLDALGRRVSHDAVRAGIRAAHEAGIAMLAYGSVYGAEREYVDAHPDERVFDEAGAPLSLGETFYINDLRPGSPWRKRLLDEYARTMRDFGFDGIHMDTYGPPHRAVSHDGEPIEFAELYPGSDRGRRSNGGRGPGRRQGPVQLRGGVPARARRPRAGCRALPRAVATGRRPTATSSRWIDRARALGDGRAVVIAAYISALRSHEQDAPAPCRCGRGRRAAHHRDRRSRGLPSRARRARSRAR